LGLHADSSIRENARRERGLFLAGFQKRIWLSEKQLLNLRCHRITMVQGTESRKGLNLPFTRRANFCRPTCWRVLRESEMSRSSLRTSLLIVSGPLWRRAMRVRWKESAPMQRVSMRCLGYIPTLRRVAGHTF